MHSDSVDVVKIKLHFRWLTIMAAWPVTVRHSVLQNTGGTGGSLIASLNVFLVKHVALLDLAFDRRVVESMGVAFFIKVTVHVGHALAA